MNNFDSSSSTLLGSFSPLLRDNIKEILSDVNFSLSCHNLKISLNLTKTYNDYVEAYADNFIVEIPYAGKQLEWEIIFKEENYSYAPDFNFINDLFLMDPDVNVISDHIPSLANWNIDNCKSLRNVIKELLLLYNAHQVMKLQSENRFSRLFSEYKNLTDDTLSKNHIEISVDNNGVVHFLIGILVNYSCLPPYVQPVHSIDEILNPYEDFATLKLSFIKSDYTKVQSCLYLTPRLDQTIGNASNLRIPTYHKDTTLSSYVADITKLLKDRVQQVSNHHKMKNEYISLLVARCSSSIIEYDNLLFSEATLLFHVNNIYAIVSIAIGNKFPQEKPKIILRSVYNLQNQKPLLQSMDQYPYDSKWKVEKMVKELLNRLQEQIPKFQASAQHHFNV
ncbi:hypothetical protein FQR65_LT07073 [Abscondita terminalis]|nr:hypothetical protein FQR65_LT07073 [Abscondita terminalis]